jgi:hypothetical protein
MSAPITEAHRELAQSIAEAQRGYTERPDEATQLIADSEAEAVQIAMLREYGNLCATNESLAKERDQLRARVERLKAQAVFDGDHIHTLNAAFATRAELTDAIARAERVEDELAVERARLDYLSTRGFEHRHHETGDHLAYEWTISSTNELKDVSLREVIDAAMKEGAK